MILNFWWTLNPPVNVRVFYRCGAFENDVLIQTSCMSRLASKAAFDRCTKREQEFVVWRDPVFAHFQEPSNVTARD